MLKYEINLETDLKHPIYFLLMRSPEIHQEIEKIYLTNEEQYKALLKEMNPQDHFFHGIQANDKWNILMLSAVTAKMQEENQEAYNNFITDLIKKSYKRIYDFTQRNPIYNQYLFKDFIENREPNVTDEKLFMYALLYLFLSKGNPSFQMRETPIDKIIIENIGLMKMPNEKAKVGLTLPEKHREEAIEVFQELTGQKWRNNETKLLSDIFTKIEVKIVQEHPSINRRINQTGNTRLSYDIKPLSYLRYALGIISSFGYDNKHFLHELMLTKEDWYTLYLNYLVGVKQKGFSKEDRDKLILFSLVQYVQNVGYRKLEDAFWQMKLSENVSEVRNGQTVLEEERLALKKEREEFERVKIKEEERTAALLVTHEEQVTRMNKEIELLKQEKEKLEEQVVFLPVLQEAVFSNQQEDVVTEQDISNEIKEMLANKQVVLVGGHDTFRKKMSEHFNNLYTIAPEEKNIGSTQVKQADIILFDTGYNNHSQFDRLKNIIRKEQILVFLNDITSIKRVEQEIVGHIKRFHE